MNSIDKEVEIAREEAKKRLNIYMSENQVGYKGYLEQEMIKILKQKGISWKPKGIILED